MQRKFILITLIFLLVLPGCAPRINVKKAPPGTTVLSSGEDVLIFGGIRWIENGKNKKRTIILRVLRAEDSKTGTIRVEKDGRFFTLLPRGTYIIHRFDWFDPWDGQHWIVPKVAFQVADSQHSYYLGVLVVNISAKRDIIGGLWVKGVTSYIEDEEDEAMEAFRKRYSDQEVKVAKALMIHDPSIPRMTDLESQRLLLDVLRSLHFGLIPTLSP
jgi:hypothetical protein